MRPENYQSVNHPPSNEFELNFGPNHPGIEGNYALKVKLQGDTVVEARADAGYLHRGFEKLMEDRLWIQNIALVPRICVPDPVPMEVCYSLAVEDLAGIEVPERAQWLRVLQLELSRIAAHLFYFGGHAATTGMYTPMYWGVADRDLLLDLFEELTGGRVYSIYNLPGGVRQDIPDGFLQRVTDTLNYIDGRLKDYDNLFFTNQIFVKRAKGIGTINQEQALEWSVTGPNLRACGLEFDVRRDDPYLIYDQLKFDIPTEQAGDAWARTLVRRLEMVESIRIIRQVVKALPDIKGPVRTPIPNPLAWRVPAGDSYARVESSKGELAYYVVSNGGEKPYRVHIRGPSAMHAVQVLEKLAVGCRVEDVAQTMFSLDACPPEVDR
ncbi:MAG: NADH-quinone oxidoreductase subunit D [Gammaproteobacteria bacterium]|jgi:NADH-quinone oxidoreductase subunit D|nr:NADH-quinone oxidoreductase subunit D [Gammaproteobacteria bacterium]MBT3722061.1 NADH-quinone oxidoreductase subunit D [Gammaproteobacteria bacterium]MBT4195954.1 NADH-quinone oxidoreductase subunit D [Gammaproteobacteria bacterium]MBT4451574.1 NADH-quinone oxidoreductase subunit D [Gammaproteobacteria bacterium]MBT4860184.1 NADH-quinone oxidoreductase subunit D [Gammaproteobacteria bacterium]